MKRIIFLIGKCIERLCEGGDKFMSYYVHGCLQYHKVIFDDRTLRISGLPKINIGKNTKVNIGKNVAIVSGADKGIENSCVCKINVKDNAQLTIGNNTGMTNAVIQCHGSITIGNYVNIGAGTMIFDTDFHSLNWKDRADGTDISKRKIAPVTIKDCAFIGAHCIILKGVTIGEKSIVGAGSIVARDVPDGEIWAGNPAKFVKKIP